MELFCTLYIKTFMQAYDITLEKEADCKEAVWCNIVTGNWTLTIGLVYQGAAVFSELVY